MADDSDEYEKVTTEDLKKRFFDKELFQLVDDYMKKGKGKPAMTLYVTLGTMMGASIGVISGNEKDAANMFACLGHLVWEQALNGLEVKQEEAKEAPAMKHRH